MRIYCPDCHELVPQVKNADGPNYCPKCERLFYVAQEPGVPPWILGVVTILMAELQIMQQCQ